MCGTQTHPLLLPTERPTFFYFLLTNHPPLCFYPTERPASCHRHHHHYYHHQLRCSSITFSQTTRLCVSTPQNALRLATVTIIITIIINFAVLLLPSHKPPASVFLPHRTPCVWPPAPSSLRSSSTSLFFYYLLTNHPPLCFYPTERPASGHHHHHLHYHHQLRCSSISFSQTTRICVSTPQNALRLATGTIIIIITINFAVLLSPSHKPPASVFLPPTERPASGHRHHHHHYHHQLCCSSITFSQTTRLCDSTPQNALRLATVTIIGDVLLFLAKITVAAGCGLIAFAMAESKFYSDPEEYPENTLSR